MATICVAIAINTKDYVRLKPYKHKAHSEALFGNLMNCPQKQNFKASNADSQQQQKKLFQKVGNITLLPPKISYLDKF